jgi:hypothetical protein
MAEATQYLFEHKELAEALVKKQNIHEGLWGIYIEFGLGATNINSGSDIKVLTPSAIASVQKIGIQRFAEPNNLTIDAAVVNPAPKTTARKKKAR